MHPNTWAAHTLDRGKALPCIAYAHRRGQVWAQAPHAQQAQAPYCCLTHMPWRAGSAFPLRVHPIALLMTMPQLLNLWVPHAPHDAWAVQRA